VVDEVRIHALSLTKYYGVASEARLECLFAASMEGGKQRPSSHLILYDGCLLLPLMNRES
jgi:hypothetical protein